METKNISDSELRFRDAIINEYNSQVTETNQCIDIIENLLSSDDTIQKLESLAYIQNDIAQSRNKWLSVHLIEIKSEIEKLEILYRNRLLQSKKTTQHKESLHFTRSFTPEFLQNHYNQLHTGRYLTQENADSSFKSFEYVFGGGGSSVDFKPLDWQKSQYLLAYYINNLFSETDKNFWEITKKCFTINGRSPNTNTMAKYISEMQNNNRDKPKGYEAIDEITTL